MSPLTVLVLVSALAILTVLMFVAVVLGIRSESGYREMSIRAHRPLAVVVRRLLGVYVGKPADTDAEGNREECLTGNSTDWWTKGGRN
jgi:hypothetical protein